MLESKDIDRELRDIYRDLCDFDSAYVDSDLKFAFIYGRFTTGNEWLDEIRFVLDNILRDGGDSIPPEIAVRMQNMSLEIRTWLEEAKRLTAYNTSVRQKPPVRLMTLKEWRSDRTASSRVEGCGVQDYSENDLIVRRRWRAVLFISAWIFWLSIAVIPVYLGLNANLFGSPFFEAVWWPVWVTLILSGTALLVSSLVLWPRRK